MKPGIRLLAGFLDEEARKHGVTVEVLIKQRLGLQLEK